MIAELDELSSRRVVLFGGKGGVGKTTVSAAAALHYSDSKRTILFTTDPASNLGDLLGQPATDNRPLRIESLDATALYRRFLGQHLESFLEIGDRGTYLDREELRRLFELSLPGVDELMAWMRIGELAESNEYDIVVVDTAPTGHTLRMLSSSGHFRQLAAALDAMEEKHRTLVRQFTRRDVRDAMDDFIDDFDARAQRRRELLTDPKRSAFVPVTLAEPLVIEQTKRLIAGIDIDVPFVVLNRARGGEVLPELSRVVPAPRACVPLDSEERLRAWTAGSLPDVAPPAGGESLAPRGGPLRVAPLTFLAGKGGVGKTSCSTSIALQLARRNRNHQYVVLSVDPAHSLRDVFATEEPPSNLTVELIDTKARWREFRESVGREIEEAVDALTPRGMSLEYDVEAIRRLLDIAPPGADELFAITRLADLIDDETLAGVIVDTAPTGHFLRLLDLPAEAGEWVREFMRLLLRYKDLIPPASLAQELVRASRALKELGETLRSEKTAVIVVTRAERIVLAETMRLIDDLRRRGIPVGGVIANYVTPENDDPCDRSMRAYELAALEGLGEAVLIERRSSPPTTLDDLESLVALL
jgi:arsenite-transporting ATPase